MKRLRVVPLLAALVALAGLAQADTLKLKMGAGTTDGVLGFTLASHGDSLRIDLALGAMTASAKAAAVRDAVLAQDATGTWVAQGTGTTLTFQHLVADVWENVDSISELQDTTGGGTQLATQNASLEFSLGLAEGALASGVDAASAPSFITISVTNSLAWTRAIQPGDTPEVLLDCFSAFLQDQADAGVEVSRQSPSVIVIRMQGDFSALNWQITDTGLQPEAVGAAEVGASTGVIDLEP